MANDVYVRIDYSHPEMQAELRARESRNRWRHARALALECAGYLAVLAAAVWWLQ